MADILFNFETRKWTLPNINLIMGFLIFILLLFFDEVDLPLPLPLEEEDLPLLSGV